VVLHNRIRRVSIAMVMMAMGGSSAFARGWEAAPSFPDQTEGRRYAFAVVQGGMIYSIGGTPWVNGGDEDGAVYTLAQGASAWEARIGLDGIGPVIHQGGGVDDLGRIVVFGGHLIDDPAEPAPDPFVYTVEEGPWTQLAPRGASAPLGLFAWCTDAQGRIYSLGGGPGASANGSNPNSTYCERYVGSLDAWEPIAPMLTGVADAAGVEDGHGHILVIGGWAATGGVRTANVARYDIASDSWSNNAVPDLPVALSGARAVLGADGRVYVMGGETGPAGSPTVVNTVYILDVSANTWEAGPPMISARKWFGAVLGEDDCIYVMGGSSTGTGTWLCEKLYTPPCPVFAQQPESADAWRGQPAALTATVTGATPMTFRWRRNGADLFDGPTAWGSVISGAETTTLVITNARPEDAGAYALHAENACGGSESASATLDILTPPALPSQWTVTNLHPAWALASRAYGVSGGVQSGECDMPSPPFGTLSHPVRWTGTADSAVDLAPGNSVGGGAGATSGDVIAGWWWWPYPCYIGGQWQTCYTRQAAAWVGMTHHNLQVSGWEYSTANDTDGEVLVGTAWSDDDVGNFFFRATVWSGPNFTYRFIHPASGVSSSFAYALDRDRVFGMIHTPYPGPQAHAAAWRLTSPSEFEFADIHPAGASRSQINGAGSGQQAGAAEFAGVWHAAVWAAHAATFFDLHSPAFTWSQAYDTASGLQVGSAGTSGGGAHAVIWATSASEYVDLHAFVPAEFISSYANAIEMAGDGTISVAGYGYNGAASRYEALMWRGGVGPVCPGDIDGDMDVDSTDLNVVLTDFGCTPPAPCPGDADQDQDTDSTDLNIVLSTFGASCP